MEQNNQIKHKNKGLTFIVVLLLTITIIASSIGLWAWAKYTSAQSGSATAQIAKWSFDLRLKEGKSGATETSGPIDLASTQFNHVANGKIAPGTSGLFYVIVDTTGTEVDVLYNVDITLTNCPRNIKFYRGTDNTGEELSLGGVNSTSRSFSFSRYLQVKGTDGNENDKYEEPIYWVWDYSGTIEGNATTYDQWDTTDSNLGTTTMTITATGTEMLSKPLSFGTLKNGQTTISNGSTINMNAGDTTTLSVTGAENVTYSSSDSSKVTVNSTTGAVEAMAAGNAVITVTGVNSGETMTVNVTVTRPALSLSIGDTVAYSTTLNDVTLNNWKVFYVDGDYTYIILDDYLPNAAISSTLQSTHDLGTYETYVIYSNNCSREDLVSAMTTTSNWSDLINNGSINSTALSAELKSNANVWAMGAPTAELWVNSWKAKYPSDILYTTYSDEITNTDGWYIGESENPDVNESYYVSLPDKTGYNNALYFPYQEIIDNYNSYGYWLASPTAGSDSNAMYVNCNGNVGYNDNDSGGYAFRPVIKLPTSVVNQ